ncbi:MAG: hypothetical protein V3V40_06355 [Nitrosomonadaceae bacterium]
MKSEILEFVGFSSAMGAAVIETPISVKVWFLGLTGNDMAFAVAFIVGVSTIIVNYVKYSKLLKEARLADIRIKKLESSQ